MPPWPPSTRPPSKPSPAEHAAPTRGFPLMDRSPVPWSGGSLFCGRFAALSGKLLQPHAAGRAPAAAFVPSKGASKKIVKKRLARGCRFGYGLFRAEVVELVDTLGSGSSSRKGVGVRVSPSAPVESPQKSRKVQKALRDLAFWAMGSPTRCREIQGQRTKKTVFMAVSPVGASFPFQKYRHLLTL